MAKNKCVLCGDPIDGYGNNAEPLGKGSCCDRCNLDVIFARLTEVVEKHDVNEGKRYNKSQEMANKVFDEEYGKKRKANLWICHRVVKGDTFPKPFKKSRCDHCGNSIVYDPDAERVKKKARKICRVCALNVKEFSKFVTKKMRKWLEMKHD